MATDPRAGNCQVYVMDRFGMVTGVELHVDSHPALPYELSRVELVDEYAAQGNTVATCRVLDRSGLQIGETVWLAWPYPTLTEYARPGNPNGQHPITNKYNPPAIGPLALCIRDAAGQLAGDVVGGLGLPLGHHVSFVATWRERGAAPDPDPDPEPTATAETVAAVCMAILEQRIVGTAKWAPDILANMAWLQHQANLARIAKG